MKHVMKLIFVTLMLTMTLNSSFSQKPIKISIDPSNDTLLVLSDGGTTRLGNIWNRSAVWEIDDPRITEFFIEGKRPGDPFTSRPGSGGYGITEEITVRFWGPTGDWYYNIWWKDRATQTEHRYDPKIAVKPGVTILELLLLFGFILTTITSIVFFRKWQKATATLTEKNLQNT